MKKIIYCSIILAIITFNFKSVNASNIFKQRQAIIKTSNPLPFTNIFKNIDYLKLNSAITSKDTLIILSILEKLNDQISREFLLQYKIDLKSEFKTDYDKITLIGLLYAGKETFLPEIKDENSTLRPPSDFGCFLTAVSTLIGIPQAQSIWNSIKAGATEQTVVGALKLIGRRVGTIIGVAIMVYEVGECLNWW